MDEVLGYTIIVRTPREQRDYTRRIRIARFVCAVLVITAGLAPSPIRSL